MSVHRKIVDGVKMNKHDTERFVAQYGIEDKNAVKELCELAIVLRARQLTQNQKPFRGKYDDIVALYRSQVNLSHRIINFTPIYQLFIIAYLLKHHLKSKPADCGIQKLSIHLKSAVDFADPFRFCRDRQARLPYLQAEISEQC